MTKPQKSAEELLSEFKKIMSDHTPPPDSIHAVSLYIDNVIWPKVTRENSPEFKWCMISADFKKNTEKSFKISNSWCFIDLNESNEFVLYISENLKSEKLLKPIHSFYIALTPKFTQSNNASIDLKESFLAFTTEFEVGAGEEIQYILCMLGISSQAGELLVKQLNMSKT